LRYTLIVTGFLVGLGELGLTVNRVVILISALGVGIGFGLQNMVNNFISGLILLFERPIHVGDAIEFDTVSGEVRRIGIRASRIRSWQGADLIVPNSQLVSERVTNWTLNDRLKRISVDAGVNYGADESLVCELLEAVARSHPKILAKPPCQCLFKGFGDSTINFELRAWTNQYEEWPQIKSELTAGIYRAVQAAGLSFPFPQRDVRLVRKPGP
jgi:small-conductance mechanosensitive channel